VEWKDIENLDSHRFHFIENLMKMSASDLELSGLTFVHTISDQLQIELVPGGSEIKLK
jgi:hypothetical protein